MSVLRDIWRTQRIEADTSSSLHVQTRSSYCIPFLGWQLHIWLHQVSQTQRCHFSKHIFFPPICQPPVQAFMFCHLADDTGFLTVLNFSFPHSGSSCKWLPLSSVQTCLSRLRTRPTPGSSQSACNPRSRVWHLWRSLWLGCRFPSYISVKVGCYRLLLPHLFAHEKPHSSLPKFSFICTFSKTLLRCVLASCTQHLKVQLVTASHSLGTNPCIASLVLFHLIQVTCLQICLPNKYVSPKSSAMSYLAKSRDIYSSQ